MVIFWINLWDIYFQIQNMEGTNNKYSRDNNYGGYTSPMLKETRTRKNQYYGEFIKRYGWYFGEGFFLFSFIYYNRQTHLPKVIHTIKCFLLFNLPIMAGLAYKCTFWHLFLDLEKRICLGCIKWLPDLLNYKYNLCSVIHLLPYLSQTAQIIYLLFV